jgi:urease subunit beta
MIPGKFPLADEPVVIDGGRPEPHPTGSNTGDRPIRVDSHYHPAGTSVRFGPGIPRDVGLVPLRGVRMVPGLLGQCRGRRLDQ